MAGNYRAGKPPRRRAQAGGQESGAERKGVQAISDVLSSLMARRGYARVQGAEALLEIWRQVSGQLAQHTRPGNVSRGVLEVHVANSVVLQELNFQKAALLRQIQQIAPEQKLRDLRFRLGKIE